MDDITFEFNSTILRPAAYPPIGSLASFLQKHPGFRVYITGHTDNLGTEAFNLRLSNDRANTIKRRLQEMGITPHRIIATGKGETMPIAPNSSPKGRALNRRVGFRLEN